MMDATVFSGTAFGYRSRESRLDIFAEPGFFQIGLLCPGCFEEVKVA